MTVQTVNLVSMTFAGSKQNAISFGTETSFDSFLVKGSDSLSSTAVKSSNVQDSQNHKVDPDDSILMNDAKDTTSTMIQEMSENDTSIEDSVLLADSADTQVEELPEEVIAEVLSVLTQIVSVLQDNLQVNSQELMTVAEQLQFELHDLFDADRIKELFLQVNEVDVSALLTDEDLYSALEQLQDILSDVLSESDLWAVLQQEGFAPETFDISVFSEQISAYVMEKSINIAVEEIGVQTKEIVIDFESVQNRKPEADIVPVLGTENSEQSEMVFADSEFGNDSDSDSFEADRGFEQASMFLHKLVASGKADTEVSITGNNAIDLYDIATQIIEQVKLHIRPDNTKMELQLNPEHLGKVELEITSKNGELSARLNVQNDHVKEAVESQMQVLRETLELQGLKVETIEVTVAEFGFRFQDEQGNTEQFQQRHQRSRVVDGEDSGATEEEFSDVAKVMQELNGNSVDYVA